MQVGPEDRALHMGRRLKHVVVVVPADAEVEEAQQVGQENGRVVAKSLQPGPFGFGSSRTMIVIRMAITPSVKASTRDARMTRK